jgi:predicted MFS family arabinose efflux permease
LVLLGAIATRPAGGLLARGSAAYRAVAVALAGVAVGAALLSMGGPLAVSAIGALVLGLGAGVPFALVFVAAQRQRPDAPAAAVGLVNGMALVTILVATPLAGLTFELPGEGRLAFAAIAVLAVAALLALRRSDLESDNRPFDGTKEM